MVTKMLCRRRVRFLVGLVVLLAMGGSWAAPLYAPPAVADFVAPLSPKEAAQRVWAAQQAEQDLQQATLATLAGEEGMAASFPPNQVYFPQTGHHLDNVTGFLDYWRAHGQVPIFGYPITEPLLENGRIVQYFERARFEYHPELAGSGWEVQLGLLGNELRYEAMGVPDPQNGVVFFPQTHHTLSGEFKEFWSRRGDVRIFGFPISEAYQHNGKIVQYFERASFEYNPDDMNQFLRNQEQYYASDLDTMYEIILGDLGRRAAWEYGLDITPVERKPGIPNWSPALWKRKIEINLTTQHLTAYEGDLAVYHAPVVTGRSGFDTPAGDFAIYEKLPVQTMQGSARGESWYVPNIPWVMYVHGGVAMHGTYWHNLFGSGVRASHGCINLRIEDAEWLYHWSDIGTSVQIHY